METCIGCGKQRAKLKHTYCKRCRERIGDGVAADVDDVPSREECRAWIARMTLATTA